MGSKYIACSIPMLSFLGASMGLASIFGQLFGISFFLSVYHWQYYWVVEQCLYLSFSLLFFFMLANGYSVLAFIIYIVVLLYDAFLSNCSFSLSQLSLNYDSSFIRNYYSFILVIGIVSSIFLGWLWINNLWVFSLAGWTQNVTPIFIPVINSMWFYLHSIQSYFVYFLLITFIVLGIIMQYNTINNMIKFETELNVANANIHILEVNDVENNNSINVLETSVSSLENLNSNIHESLGNLEGYLN